MAPESLTVWKQRIADAKAYQRKLAGIDQWGKLIDYYENRYPEGVVSVNLMFGIGRAMIPQLYYKSPTIMVRPKNSPSWSKQAKILEAADRELIEDMGLKLQIRRMILDAFLCNIGVGKVGYGSISTDLPTATAEGMSAVAEMLGVPSTEVLDEASRKRWSYHDYIKPDQPWFLRTLPEDIVVPWGVCGTEETPWAAFRIVRPIEDVKADENYSNTSDIQPNVKIAASAVESPNLRRQLENQQFVELWEIWDKREGSIAVLSQDHDKWLRRPTAHNLGIRGIGAVVLRFNDTGRDFWGPSDALQILQQVIEYNEHRTHASITRRLANVKGIYDVNKLKQEDVEKLALPFPGIMVPCSGDPNAAVREFTFNVPPALLLAGQEIQDDLKTIIGYSRNQQGEFDSDRRTATEAKIVQFISQLRNDERRDLVADMMTELFHDKIHMIIFKHWDTQRMVHVTSLGGWQKYVGMELEGSYRVKVIPDSVLPMSKEQRRAVTMQGFTSLKGDPRIKQRRLYELLLESNDDLVPDPEELLVSEEDLAKAQKQQLMMQVMLAQMTRGAPSPAKQSGAAQPQPSAAGGSNGSSA